VTDEAYWLLALGLGLVVAVVAVVLLETFLRQVHRIERGADEVWAAGKRVAANTSATWLLGQTSQRLDQLTEESGRHVDLLGPAPAGRHASDEAGAAR
jgi:pyruvate dehydrogenase complex dehydrogenase (E1) component